MVMRMRARVMRALLRWMLKRLFSTALRLARRLESESWAACKADILGERALDRSARCAESTFSWSSFPTCELRHLKRITTSQTLTLASMSAW